MQLYKYSLKKVQNITDNFNNHCFIDHNKQLKSMTNDDCLGYLLFSQQSTRHRYNIQYTINNIQYTIYNVYRGNSNIEKIV